MRYQYTIQRPADSENEIEQAEFLWRFGSWTTCTATCGTGESVSHGTPRARPPAVEEQSGQSVPVPWGCCRDFWVFGFRRSWGRGKKTTSAKVTTL